MSLARSVSLAITEKAERLRLTPTWFPLPALIPFLLAPVLIANIFPSINPHLQGTSTVIELSASEAPSGSIWINIFPEDDDIVVSLGSNERVHFRRDSRSQDDVHRIRDLLKTRIQSETLGATLRMMVRDTQLSVLLAVDQRLSFSHLRILLAAMAEAGVTEYGFETRISSAQAPTDRHESNL